MWLRCSEGQSWNENTCSGTPVSYRLEMVRNKSWIIKGFDDWTLPTLSNLDSLVGIGGNITINSRVFPNTYGDCYWSSTESIEYYEEREHWLWGDYIKKQENRYWCLDFGDGRKKYKPYTGSSYVRFVRRFDVAG